MAKIVPPTERECLHCERQDVWDEESETWVAAEVAGEKRRGIPHCVHEWDVTGTHNPIDESGE